MAKYLIAALSLAALPGLSSCQKNEHHDARNGSPPSADRVVEDISKRPQLPRLSAHDRREMEKEDPLSNYSYLPAEIRRTGKGEVPRIQTPEGCAGVSLSGRRHRGV